MRLGFVVKPLARPELRSHDSRRWQNSPHLSVSLAYLRDVFTYLAEAKISMYRMSSELAPYATHPDMPQFHRQVEQCAAELAQLGAIARSLDLRLSFHPAQHVVLNAPGPDLVARSAADLVVQAAILDAMSMGPEAVVVTHLGGVYGDREAARDRFARNYDDAAGSGAAAVGAGERRRPLRRGGYPVGSRAHRHPSDLRHSASPAEQPGWPSIP